MIPENAFLIVITAIKIHLTQIKLGILLGMQASKIL